MKFAIVGVSAFTAGALTFYAFLRYNVDVKSRMIVAGPSVLNEIKEKDSIRVYETDTGTYVLTYLTDDELDDLRRHYKKVQ